MEQDKQKDTIEFALEILNHPELMQHAEVQEWLRCNENQALYEELRKYAEAGLHLGGVDVPDVEDVYTNFRKNIRRRVGVNIRKWVVVAAAVVIAVTVGWQWLSTGDVAELGKGLMASAVSDIQPGRNRAILLTETGGRVALGGSIIEDMEVEQGVRLSYDSLKGVRYDLNPASQVHYHILRTPMGGEYKVELADGTVVWLNSGSELKYPTAFTGNSREVELVGEAYFSVKKNPVIPFVVHSRGVATRVYGTEFNVNAYAGEEMNITLVEGSVSVKTENESKEYHLRPGENACVKENGKPSVKAVNIHKYIAWKEGYFYYENERLETILKELGRWYDFEVTYVGRLTRDLRFELWADRDREIEGIIALLTKTNKIQVKKSGRTLIVSEQEH